MSVLFPKLNKPRQWDYRPIYYDPEKEERKEKLAKLQAERKEKEAASANNTVSANSDYQPSLHRGSFREAREKNMSIRDKSRQKSRLGFWIALLVMLIFFIYFLL